MKNEARINAALHFGMKGSANFEALSSGLIHQTYHVWSEANRNGIVLQQLNTQVFKKPQHIIHNYKLVYNFLKAGNKLCIPEPLPTIFDEWLWQDPENQTWRANAFVTKSFTESLPITTSKARKAATSFAQLTSALKNLEVSALEVVIPDFHNLQYRFEQFKEALQQGNKDRLKKSQEHIQPLLERNHYVDFYNRLVKSAEFKKRIMHHDCKLSNVLFHQQTGEAICPIDLDTVMPGYFFSDLGDMIRSMAPSVDEGERDISKIFIQEEIYQALVGGYLDGIGNDLTTTEHSYIHHSGLLMIYMQALRFLSDYLMGDNYYKTSYENQNYDRAANQVSLLIRLEDFLSRKFNYDVMAS